MNEWLHVSTYPFNECVITAFHCKCFLNYLLSMVDVLVLLFDYMFGTSLSFLLIPFVLFSLTGDATKGERSI